MRDRLEFSTLIGLLKSKWKLALSILLVMLLFATAFHQLSSPKYEAKIDLFVNFRSSDETTLQSNDIEMSLRLIETYSYMLKSDRILEKVSENVGKTNYSKQELFDLISIESGNNAQIITIVAQEKTAEKAVNLVNTYALVFQEEIESLLQLRNIMILSEASEMTSVKEIQVPPYLIYLIALLIGFILTVIIAVLQEFYSTKLDTVKKIEDSFRLSNLGVIPLFKNKGQEDEAGGWKEILHAPTLKESPLVEEFKRVRANIQYQMKQENMKTILVTSAAEGEGRSLISGNLATLMAMNGLKTVFIDGDLRNPTGNKIFNLPKRIGLTSMIAGHYHVDEIIQETSIPNLSFIGAGPIPSNPAEILSSGDMKELLQTLEEQFDVVFIDTPSLQVADAISLSTFVDGCLFIIDSKKTKVNQVDESLSLLEKVNAPILGTILNKSATSKANVVLS